MNDPLFIELITTNVVLAFKRYIDTTIVKHPQGGSTVLMAFHEYPAPRRRGMNAVSIGVDIDLEITREAIAKYTDHMAQEIVKKLFAGHEK